MRIILALVLSVLVNVSFASVSKSQAIGIYNRILKANNIWTCPKLTFSKSNQINAQVAGYVMTINQGMLDATNIDELALVIGHELGHFKLWHVTSKPGNEYAADARGWVYAHTAGYNMCKAKELFKKFPQEYSKTHPHPKDRYNRLPRC